jgi:hypothetical protein
LAEIILKANELASAKYLDMNEVSSKKAEVQNAWSRLDETLSRKVEQLTGSNEIKAFYDKVSELMILMTDLEVLMSSKELGSDLQTVQRLLQEHILHEKDIESLREKVSFLANKTEKLCKMCPESKTQVLETFEKVTKKLEETVLRSDERKKALQDSYLWFIFLSKFNNFVNWIKETETAMTSEDLADDVENAEKLVEKHLEYKLEIDKKEEIFKSVIQSGNELIDSKHPKSLEVMEKLQELSQGRNDLQLLSDQHLIILLQNENLQIYRCESRLINNWMSQKEQIVSQMDEKDPVSSIETLQKRQTEAENIGVFQKDKVELLGKFAKSLINEKHFASEDVKNTMQTTSERFSNLLDQSSKKIVLLQKIISLKIFEGNFDNLKTWIGGKLEEVRNFKHQEKTSLDPVIKKHRNLELEVESKKTQFFEVTKAGEELLQILEDSSELINQR